MYGARQHILRFFWNASRGDCGDKWEQPGGPAGSTAPRGVLAARRRVEVVELRRELDPEDDGVACRASRASGLDECHEACTARDDFSFFSSLDCLVSSLAILHVNGFRVGA